jgi:uncharacterized protein YbaR (Trm112 family)
MVVRELTGHSRKLYCRRCGRYFAMNDDVRILLPWDADFEKLYEDLRKFNEDNLEILARRRRAQTDLDASDRC